MEVSCKLFECAHEHILSRRGFLSNAFSGLAGVGLANLMSQELVADTAVADSKAAVAQRGAARQAGLTAANWRSESLARE